MCATNACLRANFFNKLNVNQGLDKVTSGAKRENELYRRCQGTTKPPKLDEKTTTVNPCITDTNAQEL
jgi:hypothetical protein